MFICWWCVKWSESLASCVTTPTYLLLSLPHSAHISFRDGFVYFYFLSNMLIFLQYTPICPRCDVWQCLRDLAPTLWHSLLLAHFSSSSHCLTPGVPPQPAPSLLTTWEELFWLNFFQPTRCSTSDRVQFGEGTGSVGDSQPNYQ